MNFGDPELELIDPTPNIYALFEHFDKLFFWGKLAGRAVVRWSKRMYSCAGICSYEGRGGLCDIALSEPLLKLRTRKNLVETLLHEMIHAYLFITCRDRDRDGHGPNFQAHMHRINKSAGVNISIYHDFHNEVKLYQTHVWRCNGPCQKWKPYFGIVRRSMNRAPGASDYWWERHQRKCGGTYVKIKEPEKPAKKTTAATKPTSTITKYIKNNDKNNNNKNNVTILNGSTQSTKITKPPSIFNGKGNVINSNRNRTNSVSVVETVRNVWANKQLGQQTCSQHTKTTGQNNSTSQSKHKTSPHTDSPPMKVTKIDDYFKTTANKVLKDVYGQGITVAQSSNNRLIAVTNSTDLVDCPVCSKKINSKDINTHLDECLNKDMIEKLSKENEQATTTNSIQIATTSQNDTKKLNEIVGDLTEIPTYKPKASESEYKEDSIHVDKQNIDNMMKYYIINKLVEEKYGKKTAPMNTPSTSSNINGENKAINDTIYMEVFNRLVKNNEVKINKHGIDNFNDGQSSSFFDVIAKECKEDIEPSKFSSYVKKDKCVLCNENYSEPHKEHLKKCCPISTTSQSNSNEMIVIDDDDDIFDETQTLNATGTKSPCPCCLQMIEEIEMSSHLDQCLLM